ncbi:unannotated protein [freshwater metagenome]|uniref:Unannotated protein n=1 Tax=freshwater metagenome TaxID=449393 RepID=A0A6J7J3M0_9ZZZZ
MPVDRIIGRRCRAISSRNSRLVTSPDGILIRTIPIRISSERAQRSNGVDMNSIPRCAQRAAIAT